MRKPILLLFLAFVGLSLQAQAPNNYYTSANGKTGDELKIALHNIIHNHTNIGYSNIWTAFYSTDHRADDVTKVWDMYSDVPNGTLPYVYTLGDDQCGSYSGEGNCYNREHSWPQSWFGDKGTPKCDIHHIYPTDGKVNAERSNYPYGEVKKASWTSQNGSKLGSCKTSGYSGTVFEPIDAYKGDIARGLFYMSVCYYNDDDGWGTSGMTNKSEILPWAMTMLLRWSDNDPVSQKEIDRNNAVYNVQGNRNPFIDHPEYAHMIWDENWNGTLYAITCATGLQHGSVSAPESALEGNTVAITAIPDAGYRVSSYSVYKTGSPSTTVTVSSNGTFVMPAYAVTVSATFVQDTQTYAITPGSVSHGNITISANTALSGATITLTATPDSGYSLYAWHVFKTGDMNTTVTVTNNSFTMPAFPVTVMATFAAGSGSDNYEKVTSAPADWSGEYILVYEQSNTTGYVWTGLDEANCYVSKTITDNTIANDNFVTLTIAPMTDGYSIRINGGANNGKYIYGKSNDNKLQFGDNPSLNTLSYESNSTKITSNTSVLRYNISATLFRYYKSSSYTSQAVIQLYKKASSTAVQPTHTIHFDKNGGTGSMSDQTVNDYEPTALHQNAFTRANHAFDSWNTVANGTGTYYADGATVTLMSDLTLYAQWVPVYTITCNSVATGCSISASASSAAEETLITLTATPATEYEFDSWTVTDADGNGISVVNNQFEMPASNVTVSATFVYVGAPFAQKYHIVTSTDQLVAGRTYLIVNKQNNKALGTTQNNNNRSASSVTVNNSVIESIDETVCKLTLGGENGAWTFYDPINSGYLYAAGNNSNNYLRTQSTLTNEGKWTITFDGNHNATIKTIASIERNTIMYNNSNTIFSCYESGQQSVQLFIRGEDTTYTANASIANLFPFDKHVIPDGTTLTVTGTANCDNPNFLVIEEGGQFFHQSGEVQATVKKGVTGYTENGGWYTIAAPFNSLTLDQVAYGDYDLYAFAENASAEWINYKAHQNDFPSSSTSGYLYAHHPATTLRMTGTLNSGIYAPQVNLSYENTDADIRGFNLLGNPTAHNIIFEKSSRVSDGYYYLANDETWTYELSNNVPVGRGFLVKADTIGQTVTLNPQSKRGEETPGLASLLKIDVDGEFAYVKLTEGVSMPLFGFRGRTSSVYLHRDRQSYIMLVRGEANRIDLCYQPTPGKHTLSVEAKYLGLDYLHLVDHLTGADIDLLSSPSYGFESTGNDYAVRFQLVFSPEANEGQDVFAYYVDGQIVVTNVDGPYKLEVIDITGRVVNTLIPGVYVLRLTTPDKVRIQKIVID